MIERMRISSPGHPDFLPSECLLHFVRKSKRDNSSVPFELMYKALIARIERAAATPGAYHYVGEKQAVSSRAEKIIEAVVFAFEVKLIEDRNGYLAALDYFEVNFAAAIKALRLTARAKADLEEKRNQPLSYDDDETISPEVEKAAGSYDPFKSEKIDDPAYRSALGVAINKLPAEEREVILLSLKGYNDASSDPEVITISGLLGCNDQTVRNRRKRAIGKLRKAMEDLE
ncbi:RNA polymerase sigma factor [Sinorhizobium mexicanum]|uniref:DNA-binding response regulator n=1 Tax=Sinorhizobium mexicanum TaxID=375549 RepID=A0A859QHG7_9HYPH|nr:DNA-binding response regulator [Sinorhizobium mexicanum]MBP1886535.1 hypothetical protein [Sinorhizobium mexicanum]QLL63894.1 DNA-binding response regulator [Sinorhizobium mexicanum]